MFRLAKPTAAAIQTEIAAAGHLLPTSPRLLTLEDGLSGSALPFGFSHDRTSSLIGKGELVFAAARRAFETWTEFDVGWVRVTNREASVANGQIVAVEAHTLGLWSLNMSRIIDTVASPTRFGFLYSTTPIHVEQGEERFLLELDPTTGAVHYHLEAVSRPLHALARLGFPFTRAMQHRFARESHRRMKESISAEPSQRFDFKI